MDTESSNLGGGFMRFLFMSLIGLSLLATSVESSAQDELGSQELTYELALTFKLLADEAFINGNRTEAREAYDDAQDAIDNIEVVPGSKFAEEVERLDTEVQFRQSLLTNGDSFFGTGIYRTPLNPVEQFRSFSSDVDAYIELVEEIRSLSTQSTDSDNEATVQGIAQLSANEQSTISSLRGAIADVQLNSANQQMAALNDRVASIHARQVEIASETSNLQSQMDTVVNGLNAMVLESAVSALGLPPNTTSIVEAAQTGDIDSALSEVGQAYIAGEFDSLVPDEFAHDFERARQQAIALTELRDGVEEAEALARTTIEIANAIEREEFGRALALGTQVVEKIDPDLVNSIESEIFDVLDPALSIYAAAQDPEFRAGLLAVALNETEIADAVLGQLETEWASDTIRFYEDHKRMMLSALTTLEDDVAKSDILRSQFGLWANDAASAIITQENYKEFAALAGVTCAEITNCRKSITEKLVTQSIPADKFSYSDGKVSLSVGQERIEYDLSDLLEAIQCKAPCLSSSEELTNFRNSIDSIRESGPNVFADYLEKLNYGDFSSILKKARSTNSDLQGDLWAVVKANPELSEDVGALGAKLSLGRDLLAQQRGGDTSAVANPATAQPSAASTPNTASPAISAEEQQALALLQASGPYGAAAAVAVKMISSLEQMGDLADQINDLTEEDRKLTVELLHLAPMRTKLQAEEGTASLSRRIADAQVNGAEARARSWSRLVKATGEQKLTVLRSIQDRMPLAYFYLEKLRAQYARLNQSLATWAHFGGDELTTIEAILASDQDTARFVIDPQIRLSDWFDRSIEGQRFELDELSTHWSQKKALAETACEKIGCKSTVADMGVVQVSEWIELSDLTRSEASPPPGQKLEFTLLAGRPEIVDTGPLNLISIGARIVDASGALLEFNSGLRIRHLGLGYRYYNDGPETVVMNPSNASAMIFLADSAQTQQYVTNYETRWAGDDGGALGPIEGYPLFGVYELQIPSTLNMSNSRLQLRFFYEKPKDFQTREPRNVVGILECGDFSIRAGSTDFRLIGSLETSDLQLKLPEEIGGASCVFSEASE